MDIINEGLRQGDLKYVISNYISIDQYTSKIDKDNITVAFFCNEREVAEDLRDFIEKNFYIEIRDVEIADTITEDNKYILFVEIERNINFPKILTHILDSVSNLTEENKWFFKTFGMNIKLDLNLENIKKYVRLSKLDGDEMKVLPDNVPDKEERVKESFEPININDYGYKISYISKGYINQNKFEKMIAESKEINKRNDREIFLLENHFPESQIITTEKNIFVINGNKILVLE